MSKKQFVCGFLMTFDLDQFLLIDKGMKRTQAEGEQAAIALGLRWAGIGGEIKTADDGVYYLKKAHIDADGKILVPAGHYAPMKYWQERGVPLENLYSVEFEHPADAMVREFQEETGHKVAKHRWFCFMVKEYQHAKIFMYVAFCSPDEMKKIRNIFPDHLGPEGEIQIHNVIDLFFDPEQYTFDLPYLMNMIVRESRRGFIVKLDPEGVNTSARTIVSPTQTTSTL